MNNIFYEFLEKNKLNGLEDVLEELPIFEETTMKFPGLPKNVPQPSSIDLIGVEFKLNGVMYNFYVSNVGTKTYCFITDAMMNVLNTNEQKNILATIITAGLRGKTLPKQTSDRIFKEALFKKHNLTNPKNGQDAQIDSLDITTNKKIVFTYTSIYFNQLKQQKVEMVDIAKTGTNSTQGDMQDNMPGSDKGGVENTTQNKAGASSETSQSGKKGSSLRKEMEARGYNKQNDEVKSKKLDAMAAKAIETQAERARISKLPTDQKIKEILRKNPSITKELTDLVDAVESLSSNSNFTNVFGKDSVSYYKDMIAKDNNNKEKYLQINDSNTRKTIKNIIGIAIKSIKPLVKKYGFKNVNEILVAFRPQSKDAIQWFNENHVNNHFTMKRIFNS